MINLFEEKADLLENEMDFEAEGFLFAAICVVGVIVILCVPGDS